MVLVPERTCPCLLGPTSGAQTNVIEHLVRTGQSSVGRPWVPNSPGRRNAEPKTKVRTGSHISRSPGTTPALWHRHRFANYPQVGELSSPKQPSCRVERG